MHQINTGADITVNEKNKAIPDTSQPFIIAPYATWVAMLKGVVIDPRCDKQNPTFAPDFTFFIDDNEYVITSDEYIKEVKMFFGKVCISMVITLTYPTPKGYIVLGTSFFRKYYVHFEWASETVGLALNKPI